MKIEIAVDHVEAQEFVEWLNAHGHDALMGRTTGNYVDGARAGHCIGDSQTADALQKLWNEYCLGDLLPGYRWT